MAVILKKKKRKIWIALPVYGGTLEVSTYKALTYDLLPIVMSGVEVKLYEIGHADIYLLRAQICEDFLHDTDADDLVMIDSDVGWEPGGLQRLIGHDVDFVAGAYPKRQDPITFMFRSPLDDGEPLMGSPETGLVEVHGMPGGFMRMKRSVLEKMRDAYKADFECLDNWTETKTVVRYFDPYYWTDKEGRRRCLAEDYAFCQRWRDIGGKVHLDASISMSHTGKKAYIGKLGEFINTENTQSVAEAAE